MPRKNNRVVVKDVATICLPTGERLTWLEYTERQAAIHAAAVKFIAATNGRVRNV